MTDVAAPSAPPKRTRHVNTAATSMSLRHLAREAAEQGERLVDISRRLKISPSTIHHWARVDGFRKKDVRARASLAQGPRLTGQADYPELKDLAPRARVARLGELSGMAKLRAIAAIEEGYVDYGLKWLREAQKLERGRQALKAYLEYHPPPEGVVEDDWRTQALEALEEMVAADAEGRAPVYANQTPLSAAEKAEEDQLWEAARASRAPLPEDACSEAIIAEEMEILGEVFRLKEEVKKWRLFPGRGDPPHLRAVSRGRSILPQPEPDIPGGQKLYGIEDAFPVRFNR
ncbi:hypothetical protein K1X12_06340 [Hyphomonas sp. WL0036]|uniref:hypothetical protein n=1 Tax=Hyphomonas sediminis TaxID=2866160 RepID=UPI001C80F235|nr:hypothetical protein [Hyphomonas sediminis]MBY9066509.1 hypothetical protein [Hyphomonas sediminis]